MHIIVCVKQTPSSDNVKVDPSTGCLIRDGVESAMNPFDEFAVEEAVRLKERLSGSIVTAVTMGPPQAENVIREAIARGCDTGIHICDKALAGSDTWATSYTLSMAVKKLSEKQPAGLVICGKQTNDSDTGHVGPGIAAWLDWPCTAFVRKVEEISETLIRVERLMEDGYDVLEMPVPAVLSVIKEINEPRVASLKGRLAAKRAAILRFSCTDLGCDPAIIGGSGSPTSVVKCFAPGRRTGGMRIEGADPREKAAKLISILREGKFI